MVQAGNRSRGLVTRGGLPSSYPAWVAGGAVFLVQPLTFDNYQKGLHTRSAQRRRTYLRVVLTAAVV